MSAGLAVRKRTPLRHRIAVSARSSSRTTCISAARSPVIACRRTRRSAGVSAAHALRLANRTSGRGHRLTLAVRYFPALSYSSSWISLICCSIPASPAAGPLGPERDRPGAKNAHRRLSDPGLLDSDLQPRVVRWPEQRMVDPEWPAQRPREHADPRQPGRPQPLQHLPDHRVADDPVLQRVAVNQKRRNQRPEAAHADRIPGPGAHRAQVGLPRLDVSDQPGLEIDLMDPPVVLDVDSHRPGRQPPDLIRKPVKLVGELGRICQSQHDGLARLIPARLIQAGRPAARRRRQHQPGQQGNRPVKARQLIAPLQVVLPETLRVRPAGRP